MPPNRLHDRSTRNWPPFMLVEQLHHVELQPAEVDSPSVQNQLALGHREVPLIDADLGRHEARKPTIDGRRAEIQHRRVEGNAIHIHIRSRKLPESQPCHNRGVSRQVSDDGVHPSKIGSKLHVGPLDIQPAGSLHGRRHLTRLAGQPAWNKESTLMTGHRESSKMLPPSPKQRVAIQPARNRLVHLEHAVKTSKRSSAIADYSERLRQLR